MFDLKNVFGIGQIGGQEIGQKLKFLPLTKPQDNFLSQLRAV
jgi:hypothetical protein